MFWLLTLPSKFPSILITPSSPLHVLFLNLLLYWGCCFHFLFVFWDPLSLIRIIIMLNELEVSAGHLKASQRLDSLRQWLSLPWIHELPRFQQGRLGPSHIPRDPQLTIHKPSLGFAGFRQAQVLWGHECIGCPIWKESISSPFSWSSCSNLILPISTMSSKS